MPDTKVGLGSSAMTVIGAFTAMLGFVAPNLPTDTPEWVRLAIGALLAGLAYAGGHTHKGIAKKGV